jgi:hypoxanthine phosphoribosyltransferase
MDFDSSNLPALIDEPQLQAKIAEIGRQIRRDYGDEPLVLIGVLKGSMFFLADLARHLGDHVSIDFIQASSYGNEKSSSGVVQIRKDLDQNIEGKHVLICEDIVDTGLTLKHLKELLGTRKPASLKVVALLSKPEAREHDELIDYVGFEIPNEFVVGYGLDYAERYRNLPYIAVLQDPSR